MTQQMETISDPTQPVAPNRQPQPRHLVSNRLFQGIPAIEWTRGGRLWASWYGGGTDEGPDNYAVLATSGDGGVTWTDPVAIIDPPGNVRAYDPALWRDPNGTLWWFWSQSFSPENLKIHDGRSGVWATCFDDPESPHPTFAPPRRIANGVMMNKPVVLSSGVWALPTAVWDYCPEKYPELSKKLPELASERFSNMLASEDAGKSFSLHGGADVPQRCFDEHIIVELRDGRLWMLVRTMYGIGQSFSEDQGRTWSPGEDSRLGGPNSRFFIRRLASGHLLLVNHADVSASEARKRFEEGKRWRTRSHLKAQLSRDDGRSWEGGLMLDERLEVSYPDGTQDDTGLIRIIYDHDRKGEREILLASFREQDVLAGRCVSADAKLRSRVSRAKVE